ncbi:hypothetical protein HPB47_002293 [Ixodes persulcatus]|uniref:Uncharacterized protein n=1 Tax=Ixodes persulcatus TaxID=34615 RepID=A0AC60PLM2_IXOPE|nr:hypothetical protein HPB47_002293 [Ixodes persulcatus]
MTTIGTVNGLQNFTLPDKMDSQPTEATPDSPAPMQPLPPSRRFLTSYSLPRGIKLRSLLTIHSSSSATMIPKASFRPSTAAHQHISTAADGTKPSPRCIQRRSNPESAPWKTVGTLSLANARRPCLDFSHTVILRPTKPCHIIDATFLAVASAIAAQIGLRSPTPLQLPYQVRYLDRKIFIAGNALSSRPVFSELWHLTTPASRSAWDWARSLCGCTPSIVRLRCVTHAIASGTAVPSASTAPKPAAPHAARTLALLPSLSAEIVAERISPRPAPALKDKKFNSQWHSETAAERSVVTVPETLAPTQPAVPPAAPKAPIAAPRSAKQKTESRPVLATKPRAPAGNTTANRTQVPPSEPPQTTFAEAGCSAMTSVTSCRLLLTPQRPVFLFSVYSVAELPLRSWNDSGIIPHFRDPGMEWEWNGGNVEGNGMGMELDAFARNGMGPDTSSVDVNVTRCSGDPITRKEARLGLAVPTQTSALFLGQLAPVPAISGRNPRGLCLDDARRNVRTAIYALEAEDDVLVCIDFNAKHTAWGYDIDLPRGTRLLADLMELNISLLNVPDTPTRSPNSRAPTPTLPRWQVTVDDLGSDHLPITLHLTSHPQPHLTAATAATLPGAHLLTLWICRIRLLARYRRSRRPRRFLKTSRKLQETISCYTSELASDRRTSLCSSISGNIHLSKDWRLLRSLPGDRKPIGNLLPPLPFVKPIGMDSPSTFHELETALDNFNTRSAHGPDNVTVWDSGCIPQEWRHTTVRPIPKPGKPPIFLTNLRPISPRLCLGKTVESMLNAYLQWWLECHQLLNTTQYGFRFELSTQDDLCRLQHDTLSASSPHLRIVAGVEIRNEFDSVPHSSVLSMAQQLGIHGRAYNFLPALLEDRTFAVHIAYPSQPILFIIILAGLPSRLGEVPDLEHAIYTDDITLWTHSGSPGYQQDTIQAGLDIAHNYVICRPGSRPGQDRRRSSIELTLAGTPLSRHTSIRILGFHLDEDSREATWFQRIIRTSKQLSHLLSVLPRHCAPYLGTWVKKREPAATTLLDYISTFFRSTLHRYRFSTLARSSTTTAPRPLSARHGAMLTAANEAPKFLRLPAPPVTLSFVQYSTVLVHSSSITIYTDSQEAIRALRHPSPTSAITIQIHRGALSIRTAGHHLLVDWVPAHCAGAPTSSLPPELAPGAFHDAHVARQVHTSQRRQYLSSQANPLDFPSLSRLALTRHQTSLLHQGRSGALLASTLHKISTHKFLGTKSAPSATHPLRSLIFPCSRALSTFSPPPLTFTEWLNPPSSPDPGPVLAASQALLKYLEDHEAPRLGSRLLKPHESLIAAARRLVLPGSSQDK